MLEQSRGVCWESSSLRAVGMGIGSVPCRISSDSGFWGCNHPRLLILSRLRAGHAAVSKVWVVLALPQGSTVCSSLG